MKTKPKKKGETWADLEKEYTQWCKENNLPLENADDLLVWERDRLTAQQKQYLEDFCKRWDYAEESGANERAKEKNQK